MDFCCSSSIWSSNEFPGNNQTSTLSLSFTIKSFKSSESERFSFCPFNQSIYFLWPSRTSPLNLCVPGLGVERQVYSWQATVAMKQEVTGAMGPVLFQDRKLQHLQNQAASERDSWQKPVKPIISSPRMHFTQLITQQVSGGSVMFHQLRLMGNVVTFRWFHQINEKLELLVLKAAWGQDQDHGLATIRRRPVNENQCHTRLQ